eukprot:15484069-Alexandrium_andersonii.AAC.1
MDGKQNSLNRGLFAHGSLACARLYSCCCYRYCIVIALVILRYALVTYVQILALRSIVLVVWLFLVTRAGTPWTMSRSQDQSDVSVGCRGPPPQTQKQARRHAADTHDVKSFS